MPAYYFDHNATTPLLPEAIQAITECLQENAGNPSSSHGIGRRARALVEEVRENFANWIGAKSHEIVFTSGGTEADQLALRGYLTAAKGVSQSRHIVTTAIEHPAIMQNMQQLEKEGWDITYVKPDGNGYVSVTSIESALRSDTVLVSVMAANNEVGSIQPIAEIGVLLKSRGIVFHCDAVQALGRVDALSVKDVDLMSFSAHKINGCKGVGALYIRKGTPFSPQLLGGPQERGLRAGTENVPSIAGFGAAIAWWQKNGAEERARLALLRDALQKELLLAIPDAIVNADLTPKLPNTLHVTFPGCRADMLVIALDLRGLCVSAGSACASGSVKASPVLLAMGKDADAATSSIRFSLGLGNSEAQIEQVVAITQQAVKAMKEIL